MHDEMTKIGGMIRAARKAKGMSQDALASATGMANRTIINIEKDKSLPKTENLYSLIRILDIPADSIFRPEMAVYTPEQEQLMRAIQSCDEQEQVTFMAIAWAYLRTVKRTKEEKEADD